MKNSKLRRALLLLACAVMLVSLSVGATLAYLTDTDAATNTFTVGQVDIKLDEANVDEYGDKIDETRVTTNDYHLMPGFEYIKDPTIWVTDGIGYEKAWVWARIEVKIDPDTDGKGLAALRKQLGYDGSEGKIGLSEIVSGGVFSKKYTYDGVNTWTSEDLTVRLEQYADPTMNVFYVYWLKPQDPGAKLVIFEKLTVPADWDNAEIIALNNTKIDITAYAIQADGFGDVDEARSAFDHQASGSTMENNPFSEELYNWTKQENTTTTAE